MRFTSQAIATMFIGVSARDAGSVDARPRRLCQPALRCGTRDHRQL